MFTLVFKSPEGIVGSTEAHNLTDIKETIAAYAKLGYTVEEIINSEPFAINDTSYVVRSNDSIYTICPYANTEEAIARWFVRLCKTIAFDDCSDEQVIFITYQGKEIKYCGWQPNMLMEFKDIMGNTVYANTFPNWDH